jgi:HEAT repeat protein
VQPEGGFMTIISVIGSAAVAFLCGSAADAPPAFDQETKAAVEQLIKGLQSGDVELRKASAVTLGKLGPAARGAVPALAASLKDGEVRDKAEEALVQIGAAAVPELSRALEDPNPEVRGAAAEAVGRIGPPARGAAPALLGLLGLEQPVEVRRAAVGALGNVGADADAVAPRLLPFLTDEDEGVRSGAERSLAKFGAGVVPRLRAALTGHGAALRREAAGVLGRIGPDAKDAAKELAQALGDKDPAVRRAAAEALGKIGPEAGPDALSALEAALKDADPEVRSQAALALGDVGPSAEDAAPDLLDALRDPVPEVAAAAAQSLGRVHADPAKAVAALRERLTDESAPDEVRWAAAFALARFGPDAVNATGSLLDVLQDRRNPADLRLAAVEAVGAIGPGAKKAAAGALVRAVENEGGALRASAARALGRINADSPEAVASLLACLDDRADPVLQEQAARALGDLRPTSKEVPGRLAEVLRTSPVPSVRLAADALGWIGPYAGEAAPALVAALEDGVAEVREAAASALGQIGPEARQAGGPLTEAFGDPDPSVRREAAAAVGRIGAEAVPHLLAALSPDRNWRIRRTAAEVLGDYGDADGVVDALVRVLQESESADASTGDEVRRAAAESLGKIGWRAEAAVKPLLAMLKSPDLGLRRAAAEALGNIPTPTEDPKVLQSLLEALDDQDPVVEASAAFALQTFGGDARAAIPSLARMIGANRPLSLRRSAVQALSNIDPQDHAAVTAFLRALDDGDPEVRRVATRALGRSGPTEQEAVVARLEQALQTEKDAAVRQEAASALGALGPEAEKASSRLKAVMADDHVPAVRIAAAQALLQLDPTPADAVARLGQELSGPDPRDRAAAAKALGQGRAKSAAAVPSLMKALEDKNADVSRAAAVALGAVGAGAKTAVPKLVETLKRDPRPPNWYEAADALGKIADALTDEDSGSVAEVERASQDVEALAKGLNDERARDYLASSAVTPLRNALERLRPPSSLPAPVAPSGWEGYWAWAVAALLLVLLYLAVARYRPAWLARANERLKRFDRELAVPYLGAFTLRLRLSGAAWWTEKRELETEKRIRDREQGLYRKEMEALFPPRSVPGAGDAGGPSPPRSGHGFRGLLPVPADGRRRPGGLRGGRRGARRGRGGPGALPLRGAGSRVEARRLGALGERPLPTAEGGRARPRRLLLPA